MIRNFLYMLVIIGLGVNIWSNIQTYNQAKTTINTSELVVHTFKTLRAIEATKASVLEFQNGKISMAKVRDHIQQVSDLAQVPTLILKTAQLVNLSADQFANKTNNQSLQILADMIKDEEALLGERITKDAMADEKQLQRTLVGGVLDAILIFFIFSSYLYEKKVSAKMQQSLTLALNHVESVNQSLKANLLKKDSIFKSAVHDLKNPLGSIKGFAELLADEAGDNKSTFEMTQIIQRISNSTLTLVGSILNSKEDDDSEKFNENVKVMDCLGEVCSFLEPMASKKGQKIHVDNSLGDFSFWSSRQQIQDIFYNIVGNAIKFSPHGASLSLSCFEEKNFHAVQIKDQGPGFSKEDFSRLFQPGVKLSARPSAGEDSTGIGLFSVKKAVEKFHGSIDITNNADRGACVTIRFPYRKVSKSVLLNREVET